VRVLSRRSSIACVARALPRRVVSTFWSWRPEERDAVLYLGSALFAAATALQSSFRLYATWGRLAAGPYAAAGILAGLAARHRARTSGPWSAAHRSSTWTPARLGVYLLALVGATLLPLALEVLWSADTGWKTHAQEEVVVVENAGHRVLEGKTLYPVIDGPHHEVHLPALAPGEPTYAAYFPYLPGMAVFGLPAGTKVAPRLTDARVAFSVVTVLVVVVALWLCRGPTEPRVLVLQALTALPTAAMPLATGGDDLPVAALLLLGVVLLARRRVVGAGLAFGAACSLKFTAWPVALVAIAACTGLAARAGEPRYRGALRLAAGMAAVGVPAVLPVVVRHPAGFVDNVVRFPLGLAAVRSPAASALPGHLLVSAVPALARPWAGCFGGLVAVCMAWACRRAARGGLGDAWRASALLFSVAILLAPATRIGYAVYPIVLVLFGWLADAEQSWADVVAAMGPPRASATGLVGVGEERPGDERDARDNASTEDRGGGANAGPRGARRSRPAREHAAGRGAQSGSTAS
jgi:hypothetical protein